MGTILLLANPMNACQVLRFAQDDSKAVLQACFYERLQPIQFWAMHAAVAAAGGVLVLLFGRRLGHMFRPK